MMRKFIASIVPLVFLFKVGLASPVTCESSSVMAVTITSTLTMTSTSALSSSSSSSSSSSDAPNPPATDLSTLSAVTVFTCLCLEPVTTGIYSPSCNKTAILSSTLAPYSNTTSAPGGAYFFPNDTITISIGMTAFALLVAVAACDKFNTYDGLPPGLIAIVNVFLEAAANVKAKDAIQHGD